MRPPDEPKKGGFWANRPRFLGGGKNKARRSDASADEKDDGSGTEVAISYDKNCPNCGDQCQVDLDDPVGRRVHASCPSCLHVWHTPYVDEDSNTG